MILFTDANSQRAFLEVINSEHDREAAMRGERESLYECVFDNLIRWWPVEGHLRVLLLSHLPHNEDEHGFANEFFWQEFEIPCDQYGLPPRAIDQGGQGTNRGFNVPTPDWKRGMHGGLINHGSKRGIRSDWRSHT